MTGLVVARLRSQPGQAVLVGALSGMLALTAVLGVSYARAVEESVQRTTLEQAAPADRGVAVTASEQRPPSPDELRAGLRPALDSTTWGPSVTGASAPGLVTGAHPTLVPVMSREGVCAHLVLVAGRCEQGDGQVLVSRALADTAGLEVGGRFDLADSSSGAGDAAPVLRGLRVAGVYGQALDTDTYFFGRPLVARSPGDSRLGSGDAVFVGWPTLRQGDWRTVDTTVDVPLDVRRTSIAGDARLRADLASLTGQAKKAGASSQTQLPQLLERSAQTRADARTPLPLLALQAVLLALVVLAYVSAATTEQRRPEVALARLRGQLPARAARMLVRDLALVVLTGSLVGAVAGWQLARLAAWHWLAPGVRVVPGWPELLALVASVAVALVAVVVAAVPTVREPLVSLMRSVPPRSSQLRAGIADGVVVALCVAGLVTLLGDDAGSPTALIAPGLLALAGGLLLSQVVVPVAGWAGRRLLAAGRLSTGLAALAVSRRPALRRLVAIETVAVALLVFAGAATAVAADQRQTAARRTVGAAVVLDTNQVEPPQLADAVAAVDRSGRYAVGVVVAGSPGSGGVTTVAADVRRLSRVAFWGSADQPGDQAPDLAALTPRTPAPVTFSGDRLTADVTFGWQVFRPTPQETAGLLSAPPEGLRAPAHLGAVVVARSGLQQHVDLGVLHRGSHRLTAPVACEDGCRLRLLAVERADRDYGTADLTLAVRGLTANGVAVDLRGADTDGWAATGFDDSELRTSATGLALRVRSFGGTTAVQRLDVPITTPVAATPDVTTTSYGSGVVDPTIDPDELVTGPAATGSDEAYHKVAVLDRLPGVTSPAVLLDTSMMLEHTSALAPSTLTQVWLATDDPARQRALVAALGERGVQVTGATTVRQVDERLSREGSGLSLHLTEIVGVVALLLAAAVLAVAVATSGRVRAHDLAGLRVVGVSDRTTRRAAVAEQLLVALAGVACGALLGAVGAWLSLPRAPEQSGLPAPDLSSGWTTAVLVTTVSAVVLLAVCSALGAQLGRRARPGLLREGR